MIQASALEPSRNGWNMSRKQQTVFAHEKLSLDLGCRDQGGSAGKGSGFSQLAVPACNVLLVDCPVSEAFKPQKHCRSSSLNSMKGVI